MPFYRSIHSFRSSTGCLHRPGPSSSRIRHSQPQQTAAFCTTRNLTLAPPASAPRRTSKTNSLAAASSRTQLITRHLSSTPAKRSDISNNMPRFGIRKVGAPFTLEHRVYFEMDGVPCSPFHDIPLYANEQQTILNMVVEIPRWTNAKQEVSWHPKNRSTLRPPGAYIPSKPFPSWRHGASPLLNFCDRCALFASTCC